MYLLLHQVYVVVILKEGTGTLACVTNGSAKAQCTVKVAWDYEFTVDSTRITGTPDSTYTIEYSVSPTDATIEVNGNGLCEFAGLKSRGVPTALTISAETTAM